MRIVSLEEPILTPEFAAATRTFRFGMRPAVRARMEPALLDLGEGRLRAMDEAGISLQVLSLASSGMEQLSPDDATTLARGANDRIAAAVRAYPGRFSGFATVALTDVRAAVREMHRARLELGLAGFMLRSTVHGASLDDERFEPVWAAAAALGAPVHLQFAPAGASDTQAGTRGAYQVTDTGRIGEDELGLQLLRLIVSGLFDRYPSLRLITGNLGKNLPFSLAGASGALDQLTRHLLRPAKDYFHQHFWVTTGGAFTAPPFRSARDVVGIDRMLFSIKYPFSPNQRGRRFLESLRLSEGDCRKLAHANAEQLLGLTV